MLLLFEDHRRLHRMCSYSVTLIDYTSDDRVDIDQSEYAEEHHDDLMTKENVFRFSLLHYECQERCDDTV